MRRRGASRRVACEPLGLSLARSRYDLERLYISSRKDPRPLGFPEDKRRVFILEDACGVEFLREFVSKDARERPPTPPLARIPRESVEDNRSLEDTRPSLPRLTFKYYRGR